MRPTVERLARRWWAGELGARGRVLDAAATPFAWAWSVASARRAGRLAGRGERIGGLGVVSVGNLAVGGTGKTPVSAWVVERLLAEGIPTALLAGGSGRDEALLHARWNPAAPVLVDRDRLAAAFEARARGARAVVLDDGFQHLRIGRDLDVVLLAAEDGFPGHVLPRGPFREGPAALGRADVVVVTRRTRGEGEARTLAERAAALAPGAVTAGVTFVPAGLRRLAAWAAAREPGEGRPEAAPRPSGPVLAVCAVARPDAFVQALRALMEGPIELLAFGDHHAYTARDVARIRARAGDRPVLTTAKDAVKLAPHAAELGAAYVLSEELRWTWGDAVLRERLRDLAEEAARR